MTSYTTSYTSINVAIEY